MPPPVYIAPLDDMRFCLETYGGISESLAHPTYVSLNRELVDSVLEEAARFASETLSPLNPVGDRVGAVWNNGEVIMPEGFAPTYQQFVQSGWNAAPFDTEIGGQGLPLALCTAVNEIWHGANMAFGLIPMLTQSAIELIAQHADSELKARYLPKLVTGEWTGSMCMTEPQAGSDVGAVSTRAEEDAAAPGSYRLRGTKIFITYGEHDLAANIVHLVLARVQGAPEGSKGLSLFLVPKFMVAEDGALDARNDVQCISIEGETRHPCEPHMRHGVWGKRRRNRLSRRVYAWRYCRDVHHDESGEASGRFARRRADDLCAATGGTVRQRACAGPPRYCTRKKARSRFANIRMWHACWAAFVRMERPAAHLAYMSHAMRKPRKRKMLIPFPE